mgnify:CR=1 FL=1
MASNDILHTRIEASFLTAIVLYGGLYIFIFLNIALQIRQNNPIELLHSEAAGERPPKSRRVLAGAGLMLPI